MEERYSLHLQNATKLWYHFGVYGQYPVSPGLGSLMWRHCGVPPGEEANGGYSVGQVEWDMTIGVAVASYDKATHEYSIVQKINAELGKCYEVVVKSGIQGIDPIPIDNVPCDPQQIKLVNNTHGTLDIGFTLGGELFKVHHDVSGGEIVSYVVNPTVPHTFYVDVHRRVDIDEHLSSVITVLPVKLKFENGNNSAEVKVVEDSGTVKLTDPVYSSVQLTNGGHEVMILQAQPPAMPHLSNDDNIDYKGD